MNLQFYQFSAILSKRKINTNIFFYKSGRKSFKTNLFAAVVRTTTKYSSG